MQVSRYERKYFVDALVVPQIRQFLLALATVDPFAAGRPEHRYRVCSLYLDTDDLYFYRQYTRGERSRFKLRARTYSDDSAAPVFLEVKARVDRVVTKQRAMRSREDAVAILERHHPAGDDRRPPEPALAAFINGASRMVARPVVRVKYVREAYVGIGPRPVRVTFDTHVEYQPTTTPDLSSAGGRWSAVPLSGVILEVKFTDQVPSWIDQMVRVFGLEKAPCCKYALSIDHMLRAPAAAGRCARLGEVPVRRSVA